MTKSLVSKSKAAAHRTRHVGLLVAALLTTRLAAAAPPEAAPVVTPPKLIRFVEAPYPEAEKAAGKTAVVVLRLTVDENGQVTEATAVTGPDTPSAGPNFEAAAIGAARAFVFEPARAGDEAIPVRILYRYEFKLTVAAPTTGRIRGLVKVRGKGVPLPGVTVTLSDAASTSPPSRVTGEDGRFAFDDVLPGPYSLGLSGAGFTPLQVAENVVAGEELSVVYAVTLAEPDEEGEEDDVEILVVAPPLRREATSTEVVVEDALRIPGAQGDVLKVVESMPGVGRASVGSGQLVVWGASPEETRSVVNGVPIPRLYHQGGFRSVIHTDLVKAVELIPAAYGAGYGRGLGGLVNVTLRPLDLVTESDKEGKSVHGSLSADLFDASGTLRFPLGGPVLGQVAARGSYLKALATSTFDDVEDLFPLPEYWDVQARIATPLGSTQRVELWSLVSSDSVSRGLDDPDPARVRTESRDLDFFRVAARYEYDAGGGAAVVVTPWFGRDESVRTETFGEIGTTLATESWLGGLRASWRGRIAPWLTLETGLDLEISGSDVTRRGSMSAPAREGDIRVFGQPPPDVIGADQWTSTFIGVAPYIEADFAFLDDRLHIVPGLRLDPLIRTASARYPATGASPGYGVFEKDFVAEPRLAIRYSPIPELTINAAVGLVGQPPPAEDLSAVFGNPTLGAAAGVHTLAGVSAKLTETLTLEVTGFYTESERLAVRSPVSSPLPAEALVAEGEGRAYGGQLLVRQDPWNGLFGWISYSYIRSERRAPGGDWRLSDFDQTHLLTAVVAYEVGLGFDIGARVRVASGFPRTPVVSTYFDSKTDAVQPLFGAQNSERIPLFVQLDLRVEKVFEFATSRLSAFLEVQNVTNQENPEELVYSTDFTRKSTIAGLGVLPVLGVKWDF